VLQMSLCQVLLRRCPVEQLSASAGLASAVEGLQVVPRSACRAHS
jgi:hypothetical protein